MSTKRLGQTLTWLLARVYDGALIDGPPADKVKAGDEREISQRKDQQLYSWVKEADAPPGTSILLTSVGTTDEKQPRSRCVLKDFAIAVRVDVFDQRHLRYL